MGRLPVRRPLVAAAVVGLLAGTGGLVLSGGAAGDETHAGRLAALGRELADRLPAAHRSALSSGGRQLLELGDLLSRAGRQLAADTDRSAWPTPRPAGPGEASDPYAAEDFASRLAGMTQSEPSAAWCGPTAAIGWNDSGSLVATQVLGAGPAGNLSFVGWATSTDGGRRYVDRGPLIAPRPPRGVAHRDLFGDPVLGCTSASTFYLATLAAQILDGGDGATAIAVSRSTDRAASFPRTTLVTSRPGKRGQLVDKPWLAVHPGPTAAPDDDMLHVTYTVFDMSGTSALCGPDQARVAIEYSRSGDGGRSWRAPAILGEVCGDQQLVHGSQVAVGPDGQVYVGWQRFARFADDSDIRLRRSGDAGGSWGPERVVNRVVSAGAGFGVQGNFRTFLALQGLAVDTSRTPSRGTVYLSWHDGRRRSQPDPFGGCAGAAYCFADALLTRSTDRGATWSAPVRVNTDDPRRGVDQLFPAMAVDRDGRVWVGFYDRRRDPRNFLIDMFVAWSDDRGRTWRNRRLSTAAFAPVLGGQDALVFPLYMGDYQAVAIDRLGTRAGAIVAWGDNSRGDANVLHRRVSREESP
jgi:hypothetical protein